MRQSLNIEVKNCFILGDNVELILSEGNIEFTLEKLLNKDGKAIDVAPGSGHQVKTPCSGSVSAGGLLATRYSYS